MKKTIKRRTEITIETHQTTIWRAPATPVVDPTPPVQAVDDLPEVMLFIEERLEGSPDAPANGDPVVEVFSDKSVT